MRRVIKSLALFLAASALFISVMADAAAVGSPVYLGTAWRVSPGTVMTAATTTQTVADVTVGDYNSMITAAAKLFVARSTHFKIKYNGISNAAASSLISTNQIWDDINACDLPETTSDLDYLRYSMRGTSRLSGISYGTYAVFEFSQSFYTTAEQEADVDKTTQSIVTGLYQTGSGAGSKIQAIHDYIVKNVEYDRSLSRFSAYDALYSKQAVCNGYALLMYKMLMESGVPVRLLSGKGITGGNAVNHAWNIVKIGSYWYNIDATWDDSTGTNDYFLKSNAGFPDHIRDSEYKTTAFNTAYPMSPTDYDGTQVDEPELTPADSPPSPWALNDITALTARSIVPQALQSYYQADISRAEFTGLMVNVFEYAKGSYKLKNKPPFTDISASPYQTQISKGYELGIINGVGPSTFAPNGSLTREQCAKIISVTAGLISGDAMLSNARLPYGDAGEIQSWALPYVRYAYDNGLMNGKGQIFDPSGKLTREQAMVIAERLLEKFGW